MGRGLLPPALTNNLRRLASLVVQDEATRPSLLAWSRHYLARYFSRPSSRMHTELAARLDEVRMDRGARLVVEGPRGHAKSTLCTLAAPLRAICEGEEAYIWLIADTQPQARLHLSAIKTELESNPALLEAYPEATGSGPTWQETRFVARNGTLVEALGMGQRMRGRRWRDVRPSLVVIDDPEDETSVLSAERREKSMRWLQRTVLNAGGPRTNVLVIGTALHRECMVERLRRSSGWRSLRYRALEAWPARMDLWAAWEEILSQPPAEEAEERGRQFYLENQAEMDRGGRALWPELEDVYSLMLLRSRIGHAAWETEKQNHPVELGSLEWPESYFGEDLWFSAWPEVLVQKIMALDPSKGRSDRTGDYQALVRLGVGVDGTLYVEADLQRRPIATMVRDAIGAALEFRPQVLAVEANAFQELLGLELERAAVEAGTIVPILTIENTAPKIVRIRALGPYLARRRIRFRRGSPGTLLLYEQMRDFPTSAHDDGPDALEMAIRIAQQREGLRSAIPEGYAAVADRRPRL